MKLYKVKMVEFIEFFLCEECEVVFECVGYNVFNFDVCDVYIDFLIDLGMGMMFVEQWVVMICGDEVYVGSELFV